MEEIQTAQYTSLAASNDKENVILTSGSITNVGKHK